MNFFANALYSLIDAVTPKSMRQLEEEYLSRATDLSDLERRMRRVQQGTWY